MDLTTGGRPEVVEQPMDLTTGGRPEVVEQPMDLSMVSNRSHNVGAMR